MRIFIEDYYGNDLACISINSFKDISEIDYLTDCSLADVESDETGEYIRVQLETK